MPMEGRLRWLLPATVFVSQLPWGKLVSSVKCLCLRMSPYLGPKATRPSNHEEKALKPWATVTPSSFQTDYLKHLSQDGELAESWSWGGEVTMEDSSCCVSEALYTGNTRFMVGRTFISEDQRPCWAFLLRSLYNLLLCVFCMYLYFLRLSYLK